MPAEFIFDRAEERQRIDQFLVKKRPFILFGPSGVGKSLLLHSVLPPFHSILHCEDSNTINTVFRTLAVSLLRKGSPRAQSVFRNEEGIKAKSAVSLKGIVMDSLREGEYSIILDHLKRPSYSFASAVREIMSWGSTPVSIVARSAHMEDTGFLQPVYGDRSQKCEILNFHDDVAEEFAREVVKRNRLFASNMGEFMEKVLEFSQGNPGAIVALVEMARNPKYRADEHIKITVLYIDFRMNWGLVK
jgi:hypothetical protein